MFNFILGIAVGAAFAPFWMTLWGEIKPRAVALIEKMRAPKQ